MSGGSAAGLAPIPAIEGASSHVPTTIEPVAFEFLRSFVARHSALVLEDGKEYLAINRLVPVLERHGLGSVEELIERLRTFTRGPLADEVVEAMTTNETSFFRDPHVFDALRDEILPRLWEERGTLRIWSGACSSGQEPYTLAMLVAEHFPHWRGRVSLLATDLSSAMVARTAEGRFSRLEVNRGLPANLLVAHFTPTGPDWVVNAELRSMIECRRLNLLDESWGVGTRDLVLLRNVLIYMPPETKAALLRRIRTEVLRPGGVLVLGSSETTLHLDDGFERVEVGRAIWYRRPE